MQMDGTIQGIKFSYFGYYYSDKSGSTQLLVYTASNLADKYKIEIENFLNVEKIEGKGIDSLYQQQQIYVKGRTGGERCKPFGRNKSQKLKKLFQEYEIPLWQRDRLPLIYIGGKLAAVGDLWVCEEFHAQPNKQGISINWTDNLTI